MEGDIANNFIFSSSFSLTKSSFKNCPKIGFFNLLLKITEYKNLKRTVPIIKLHCVNLLNNSKPF